MKRQKTVTIFLLCFVSLMGPAPGFGAAADSGAETIQGDARKSLVNAFCGETLYYDVGFWFLPKAGTCQVTFERKSDVYVARLEAKPVGFLEMFIPYKKEVMKSVMVYDPDSRRMKPLEFHETYFLDDEAIEKKLMFDYAHRRYRYTINRDGRHLVDRTYRLPKKHFDDILTFIYNLRLGSYGRIKKGRQLNITVLTKQRLSRMSLFFEKQNQTRQKAGEYTALLSLDRNTTNALSERIVCWFSKDFIPLGGKIEDAIFFGDLHVVLSKRVP